MDIRTAPTTYTLPEPARVQARSTMPAQPAQPRMIVAVEDSGDGFTVVRYSDGTTERRTGSRGIRNNNPGNLTGTLKGALAQGAVAVDHGGNYVFPSEQAGKRAMANFVIGRNAERTIGDMLNIYAPPGAANDPKNTNRLYPKFMQDAGFDLGTTVGSLGAPEQQRLLQTMMQMETGQQPTGPAVVTDRTPARLPLQERLENSGILPMLGGGVVGMADFIDQNFARPAGGSVIGNARDLGKTAIDFGKVMSGNMSKDQFLGNARDRLPIQPMPFGGMFSGDKGAAAEQVTVQQPSVAPVLDTQPDGLPSRLGLLSNPAAATAVVQEAQAAAQQVATQAQPAQPLTKPQRQKMNPLNLGLITFGLSLLGGQNMTQAISNGMAVSDFISERRTAKERRNAFDDYIQSLPPEEQEIARALDASGNIDVLLQAQLKGAQDKAEAGKRLGLVNQLAQLTDVSPQILAQMTTEQLQSELTERVFSGTDGKKFTAKQTEAAFAALEMSDAIGNIYSVIGQGFNPTRIGNDALSREQKKQFDAAFDRFLTAFIPFKSGKVFTEAELAMYTNALKPKEGFEAFTAEVNQQRLEALDEILGRVIGASQGAYEHYRDNAGATGFKVPTLPGSSAAQNPIGVQEVL